VLLVSTLEEAWRAVNDLAPEHLELQVADPWRYLDAIENAGAIFIGSDTPEPGGGLLGRFEPCAPHRGDGALRFSPGG